MDQAPSPPSAEAIYTVSELNRQARFLLEDNFPAILVEGEISNIARPTSKHWYFTLKDENAQVRCAMFRNRNFRVRFRPANGMKVLARAKLSLYEDRGDYQLILESMQQRGDGALLQAFEELKAKLQEEGLFDPSRKKPLPALPRHIGLITSPSGAAVRDVISTLRRRFPAIAVTVIPVPVQGDSAARDMIAAIRLANRRQGCLRDLEALIIGRGGGSLEDLWSFNDEALARCIHASELPIVSAVGHEVDFTISDFAADLRAATPTAAAELLSPDQQEYRQALLNYERRLSRAANGLISQKTQALDWLGRRLRHPRERLGEQARQLDEISFRLHREMRDYLERLEHAVRSRQQQLFLHSPRFLLAHLAHETSRLKTRLPLAMRQLLRGKTTALAEQSRALDAISPLNTLKRGYAISRIKEHEALTSYAQAAAGDTMHTRLHEGVVISTVQQSIAPETDQET